MNVIQKTVDWFDGYQRQHKFIGFPLAVFKKYGEDQAGHKAALLTYYAFLALFPLLLVLTTVLKVLIRDNQDLRSKIIEGATNYFPVVGNELQQNVHTLGSTGWILAVGIVLTLFGARGVADALRDGINHIWQIPFSRRSGFPHSMLKSFAILLVGGTGLILAPVISGYAISVGGHGWLMRSVALLITLAILYLMFLSLVRIALPTKVTLRELRPAAVISTVGLVILQIAGGYVLTHELRHFNTLYGTFAVVLGLLFWLYLQAQMFFYAIETASVRALRLWPRAIDQQKLTPQDRRAFRLHAERGSFNRDTEVTVRFKDLLK
jgi:YihY family inner membrane protein